MQKLFEMATAPKMQVFMTFMIVYLFIGNQLSIYTIFAIVQSLTSSIGGLFKVNQSNVINNIVVFEPYEEQTRSLFKYKLIYVAINLVSLAIVSYKLSKMGLISLSPSAYIDLIPSYEGTYVTAAV